MRLNIDFGKTTEIAKSFGIEVDENKVTLEELYDLLDPYLERIKKGKVEDNDLDQIPDEVFLTLSKGSNEPSIQSDAPFVKQYQAKHDRKMPETSSLGFGGGGITALSLIPDAFETLSKTEEKSEFVRRIQFPKTVTKFKKDREDLSSISIVPTSSEVIMKPTSTQDRGFITEIDRIQVDKLRAGRAKEGTYNSDEVRDIARRFGLSTKGTKAVIVSKIFNLVQEWRGNGEL